MTNPMETEKQRTRERIGSGEKGLTSSSVFTINEPWLSYIRIGIVGSANSRILPGCQIVASSFWGGKGEEAGAVGCGLISGRGRVGRDFEGRGRVRGSGGEGEKKGGRAYNCLHFPQGLAGA